ncbi:unnamed protein product [Orchesella dallaii]|uniref:HAT C-terminal dimerisation domain-containing protein n=1 Tax=Orchesella dallaii TaxID=48710 RepID=A0ABP1Q542_9HEXA
MYYIPNDECKVLYNEWKILLAKIISSGKYSTSLKNDPSQFWTIVLKDSSNELQLTEKLKTLLKYILVTPFASAECERGFSVLTRVDADARSRLSPETIQHILRIIINGTPDLSKINVYELAKAFLVHHVRVDDTSVRAGRPKGQEKLRAFPPSRLF